MFGKFTHNVDPKGRLFVPAKLREELGDVFYVMIGFENSLMVFPESKWEQVNNSFNSVPLSDSVALRYIRSNVARCEPDKQGRFVLPPLLRKFANLTGDVTFLGQGDHAEIWDAATYEAKEASWLANSDNLANALKELGL
ncbi:MAG: division/cell wall cluster transcriptional repressor MraZ [Oscillospiraceae bacterium]|nr:division/cell wall cluster transcriptional repressor MraZ [Oscillospiraceae bacterium]